MIGLGLVADDLTGALDSAAQFARKNEPIPVYWPPLAGSPPGDIAVDIGTRELPQAGAVARSIEFAPVLENAQLAYKKIDSQLRGHVAAELAAILRRGRFDQCILAPALPFHGRFTRGGVQFVRQSNGEFARIEVDLTGCDPGSVVIADAETDDDLTRIAREGLSSGRRILWCGSAGLAAALSGEKPPAPAMDAGPALAVIGTDHASTLAQLACARESCIPVIANSLPALPLERCILHLDPAPGLDRLTASARIRETLALTVPRMRPPGRVIVTGGETFTHLCAAIGARRLDVEGQLLPGVPVSRFRGGAWDRVQVISKSGAFGDVALLRRLLESRLW